MWVVQGGVFPQPAVNILHVDDGVIDDHADGNGEAAEGHRVHADAGPLENEHGDAEGKRHGHERDEGGAEIQQEDEDDDGDHDRSVADGFGEITDGMVDEVLLLEKQGGFHAFRERRLEFCEGLGDFPGECAGVEAGSLGDRHDHAVGRRFSGAWLTVASPRIGSIPQTTLATSPMEIGRSFTVLTMVLAMSPSCTVMARLRTMISVVPVLMKPPVVVLADSPAAFSAPRR